MISNLIKLIGPNIEVDIKNKYSSNLDNNDQVKTEICGSFIGF